MRNAQHIQHLADAVINHIIDRFRIVIRTPAWAAPEFPLPA
jgi:hypothetical protein